MIVNNAGLMTFKTLAEWTADDWLKVLHVDLLGAAFFTKQAFLRMGDAGGAIVNIASVHAIETSANAAPYAAAILRCGHAAQQFDGAEAFVAGMRAIAETIA